MSTFNEEELCRLAEARYVFFVRYWDSDDNLLVKGVIDEQEERIFGEVLFHAGKSLDPGGAYDQDLDQLQKFVEAFNEGNLEALRCDLSQRAERAFRGLPVSAKRQVLSYLRSMKDQKALTA